MSPGLGFYDVYFWHCDKKNAGVVWTQNAVNAPYYHAILVRRTFLPILCADVMYRHSLGCSPPSRPTKSWIEGHNERYVLWGSSPDAKPLQDIQRGEADCTSIETCGGANRGYCDKSFGCLCQPGFTGPRCLSPFSDAKTDMYQEVYPPGNRRRTLLIVATVLIALIATLVLIFTTRQRRKRGQNNGYNDIPSEHCN
jgi:hypothetical protein